MQRKVGPLSESIGGLSNTARHDTETKLRTYAALAAHGRARRSPSSGESGGSRTELAPGGPTTSAFFKLPHAQQQQQVPGPRQHRGTPLIGSVTPPSCRPAARFAADTPDSATCPFAEVDDDILFQMSGLKPLRTSSRVAAAAAAAATAATPQGARSQCKAARRMCSAVKAETRPAEPVLDPAAESDAQHASIFTRAFATSNEVSPRDGDPAPTAATDGTLPTRKGTVAGEPRRGLPVLSSPDRIRPAAVQAEVDPAEGSPGSDVAAKAAAAAAAAAAEAAPAGAAPGWSEELLNWMLNEKAGLLMEAQRATRRQQELEAELGKLRARGSGTEREAQHLAVERRALLSRVQQLSAAEAEAAARAERLAVDNDSLTAELERSQEVCREMLAARRAARDALAEMSAQNARLLAAYVAQKQEAAQLKEELRRHQLESERRIQALEMQLALARASRHGLQGSLCSPLASPRQAGSPCSERTSEDCPQDGIATPTGLQPASSQDASLPTSSLGRIAREPSAPSPLPNKENASGNAETGNCGSKSARRACKEEWDEERSELLSLLERLQGQLEARAGQQAATADGTPKAPLHSKEQARCAEDCTEGCSKLPVGTPVAAQKQQQQQHVPGLAVSSPSGGSSAEASFDSAGEGTDGSSPTVMAHHMADSPGPPMSPARSCAPSPPSVRPQRSAPDTSPGSEAWHAGSEQTPASRAAASEPVPATQQGCAMQGQTARVAQQRHKLSSSGGRTLDAFFGRSPSEAEAAVAPATAAARQAAGDEQERLQQAEQRAAELEAEVERLRAVNAAAQEKVQREEWRRTAESAKSAGNAAFQAQQYEEALQQYSRGLETLVSCSRIGSSAGCSSSESIDAALAAVLHCNRAAVHQACGRYLHALADCFRAEALEPSYSRIYHRRADAYWAIGAWDAAAQDLGRLLELGGGQDVAARLVEAQRRSQAGQPANHYSVLGLRPAAAPGEVKAAYRQLARGFHPDKAAGEGLSAEAAHSLFKLLSEAAGVLGDAEQRRQHDIATLRHKYRRQYAPAF